MFEYLRSSVSNGRPYCFRTELFLLLLRSSVSNGRPYCYSIVSFSLLLLRSSVSNGRPYCYCIVSFSLLLFFFSYRFCPEDFSETARSIFMKLSGMIDDNKNLIYFFLFWWRHFRSRNIVILLIFRGSFVRASPPKRLKISHSNFQEW